MLRDELRARLKGTVLVVGIGNTLRGDDGFGPRMLKRLEGKVSARLLDVGEVPESYLGRLLEQKARTILVLDAADIGEAPGTATILEAEDLAGCNVSTHQMPLELFFRHLRENTHADVFALGVQPKQIALGSEMSPEVESTARILSEVLIDLLGEAPAQISGASRQVKS
ncbi:MAG: hydrogenase 3 maturation endopeptidase HyCI [Terriglobia bacterium]